MKSKFFLITVVFVFAMTASAPRVFAYSEMYLTTSGVDIVGCSESGGSGYTFYGLSSAYGVLDGGSLGSGSSCSANFAYLGSAQGWIYVITQDNVWIGWAYYDGAGNLIPEINQSITRINSVSSPLDGATTTTTVTFSGSYYVSSLDLTFDSLPANYFDIYISNASDNATSSINNQYRLRFPVTLYDQTVSFSTTTTVLDNQRYIWQGALNRGDINILQSIPFPDTSKSFYQFTTGNFDPSYGLSYDISSCNLIAFSGFDIQDCLYNLIFPNNFVFALKMNEAKEAYIHAWPIGYWTRFIYLLTSSSTEPLPELVLPTPFGDFNLTPWNFLFGSTSPLTLASSSLIFNGVEYGDHRSFRDIVEPYWNLLWYILLGLAIIHDITGIGRISSKHKIE